MPARTRNGSRGHRRSRRREERLTRERVVEAALRIMDDEGLDAVTMRRVAREVGVEAMSLYHHVRDKEDLLDGICAAGDAAISAIPDEDRPWIEVARDGAREWRRVLREHPNVIALWADRQRPMTELEALLPMEFALRVIARAGHRRTRGRAGLQRARRLHHGRRDDGGRSHVLGRHRSQRRQPRPHSRAREDPG